MPLNRLSAVQMAAAIERNEVRSVDIVRACLERIAERNEQVQAFVSVDPQRALAEAEGAQQLAANKAALRGVPYAVKDIIDTAAYPTSYGSPVYRDHRPAVDASCVTLARNHGAVLLGKVVTSEFATQTPGPTRNPHNLAHTPGGSSSGSAAAVADFMTPLAFGSQTTGSITRPAAYCGVVGYKPSFGLLGSRGMKPLSPSQDTLGVLARTVQDAAFFTLGLHGSRPTAPRQKHVGQARIALCTSSQWSHLSDETVQAIERLVRKLESAGQTVRRMRLPEELEAIVPIQSRIFMYEARQTLAHECLHHYDALSPRLHARLDAGKDITLADYMAMQRQAAQAQLAAQRLFQDLDAVLYPAADGEAEAGLIDSGSPRFGAIPTLMHLPSVAFPIGVGAGELPLGAQLIGPYMDDLRLLELAGAISEIAGASGSTGQ